MKNIEDDDFDVHRDMFLAPATDVSLESFFALGMEHFAKFPSPTAMSQLAAAGILVRGWDLIALGSALSGFHAFPSLHLTPENIAREEKIAALSAQLRDLLKSDEKQEWRYVWRNGDFSDEERPEPEDAVEVADLRANLMTLQRTAEERLEWLASAKNLEIDPGSNRADRIRYFYWLMLIAFWKYQLKREVGTCTAPDKDAYGPLIKLIQVMSARGMSSEETKGSTIRAFIRRNADRASYFEEYFKPHSKAL